MPTFPAGSIVVAMGMLGAIVMPHNIYLHSNTIQSREWDFGGDDQTRLMRYELIDTSLSMGMGWLVNSAMILVAAAVFYSHGITVSSIQQASATLRPLVGPAAQLLFGLALLVAGLSSSITSSLADGQRRHRLPGQARGPAQPSVPVRHGRHGRAGRAAHHDRAQRLPGPDPEPGRAQPAAPPDDRAAAAAHPAAQP